MARLIRWSVGSLVLLLLLAVVALPVVRGRFDTPGMVQRQDAGFSPVARYAGSTPAPGSQTLGKTQSSSNPVRVEAQNLQSDIAFDVDYAARMDPWVPRESALIVHLANARGGAFTEREMRAALTEAGWAEHHHATALRVFWCESRYNPRAIGDGGLSLGAAQMGVAGWRTVDGVPIYWQGWFRFYGVDEALAFDIITNLTVARWAFERSGWDPWSCA